MTASLHLYQSVLIRNGLTMKCAIRIVNPVATSNIRTLVILYAIKSEQDIGLMMSSTRNLSMCVVDPILLEMTGDFKGCRMTSCCGGGGCGVISWWNIRVTHCCQFGIGISHEFHNHLFEVFSSIFLEILSIYSFLVMGAFYLHLCLLRELMLLSSLTSKRCLERPWCSRPDLR